MAQHQVFEIKVESATSTVLLAVGSRNNTKLHVLGCSCFYFFVASVLFGCFLLKNRVLLGQKQGFRTFQLKGTQIEACLSLFSISVRHSLLCARRLVSTAPYPARRGLSRKDSPSPFVLLVFFLFLVFVCFVGVLFYFGLIYFVCVV